jgi:hypothetical protein
MPTHKVMSPAARLDDWNLLRSFIAVCSPPFRRVLKSARLSRQALYSSTSSGLVLISLRSGSISSRRLCSISVMKAKGSPLRKTTSPGRVICQFIVNGNGSQSVSTRPVSGVMPSFGQFGGPVTQTPQPIGGGARFSSRILGWAAQEQSLT